MTRTVLYRHFDDAGRLLYVGISLSVIQRLRQHEQRSHWADDIATVRREIFPSRDAAERAERKAIREELPLYNVAGAAREKHPSPGVRRSHIGNEMTDLRIIFDSPSRRRLREEGRL